jgi:hypothetical protein
MNFQFETMVWSFNIALKWDTPIFFLQWTFNYLTLNFISFFRMILVISIVCLCLIMNWTFSVFACLYSSFNTLDHCGHFMCQANGIFKVFIMSTSPPTYLTHACLAFHGWCFLGCSLKFTYDHHGTSFKVNQQLTWNKTSYF